MMQKNAKLVLLGLMMWGSVTGVAHAEPAGVSALVNQGRYWQGKGRQDLANQAFRKALALDPTNAVARAALSGAPPKESAPVAQPRVEKVPAPQPVAVARPRGPAPAPMAAPQPRPVASDTGGDARAAGFRALEGGDTATASRLFQSALQRNRNDADAAGGLGLVRLREERFAEARDLLERASQRGNASKWANALASARFYAQLQAGQAAVDAGRLEEGRRIAEALVASDFAKKQPALDLLAGINEREGRYSDAAQLYDQATRMAAPGDRVNRGNGIRAQALSATQSGNSALAEQLFQQGLMADPSDPWIRYEFARFLEAHGRRADADGLIASLANSGNSEGLYAAALLNSQSGRPADAEALLDRIPKTAFTPEMRELAFTLKTDAAIARAKAMASRGLGGQATAALRQLAGTPGLATASQGSIAEALLDLGDQAGAAMVAQQALSTANGDASGMESIVRVLTATGQDALAQSAVQRLSGQIGNSPDGQRAIGKLNGNLAAAQADRLRESGQYAAAFDLLQSQWNAAPGNSDVLNALARLYQSGGMPVQAAQTYQIVLNQSPNDVGAMIGLVDAATAGHDFPQASATFNRVLALAPNDYNVYLAGGRLEQARGDERNAKRYFQRARELYIAKTMPTQGGFTASNPFAAQGMANGAGFGVPQYAAPQPVNPFAFAAAPGRAPSQQQAFAVPGTQPVPANYAAGGAGRSPSPFASGGAGQAPAQPMGQPFGQGGFPAQAQGSGTISDPVLASIDRDLQTLSAQTGPRVDVQTGYRSRSGETGLSQLKELTGEAQFSTDFAGGRVSAKAKAVVLDAGRPTGSGLARFGRNATAEAVGIVAQQPSQLTNADTQSASGVAVSVGYENKLVKADIGTTPMGFPKTHIAGGITVMPRLSRYSSVRLWAERRPVTDSIIAYAGTKDPVTGGFWGAVMKDGGGASYSYDRDGSGIYGDVSYYEYSGTEVQHNNSIQVNVGGYLRAYRSASSTLTVGLNANYQDYKNNQNFFTFGQGGYFSPQSFLSVSFPVRYAYRANQLEVNADVTPGYQSYSQDAALLYPNDPAAQAQLDFLKSQNPDVRARYDSISKTGFGISAGGSAYYVIGDNTRVGGELNINTFGEYKEFRSLLGIKQQIGGKQ